MTIDDAPNPTNLNDETNKAHSSNPFKNGSSFVVNENINITSSTNSNSSDNAANNETEELKSKIKSLEEQLVKANNDLLYRAAETQNIKKRSAEDIEKMRKFALENFARDLLAVIDSLERGLELTSDVDDSAKALREGMQLTLKLILDILQKHQIEVINPILQTYDPKKFHQSINTIEDSENPPNTVIKVLQKGYSLNGRSLRDALVTVSKAPTQEAD